MKKITPAVLEEAAAVLPKYPENGINPRFVARLIGWIDTDTASHALRELVAAGRAAFRGPPGPRRTYHRLDKGLPQ